MGTNVCSVPMARWRGYGLSNPQSLDDTSAMNVAHAGQAAHKARRLQRGRRVSSAAVVGQDLALRVLVHQGSHDGRLPDPGLAGDQKRRIRTSVNDVSGPNTMSIPTAIDLSWVRLTNRKR